ncbi:MAG: VTT domain-containing protein [Chloroflexi bacterium]|nr:VTT domain-containing protein [Chloroflexota bacterium]
MTDSSQSEVPETQVSADAPGPEPGTAAQLAGFQLWLSNNRETVFRLGLITFVIGFVILGMTLWLTGNLRTENIGYGGVWIIGFIAAGSIILPIPGPAAVCIAATPELGLTPLYIGVVSASAEALGEMTGYMAGLSGRSFIERSKYYSKFHSLVVRRGGIILFVGSVIPNPLFDVLGIAAGSIGYPIKRFLAVVFIGKAIKSTGIAYLCLWGIDSFVRWLG